MALTTDLIQLRWQHIRTVELSQSVQKENIEFRRKLVSIREELRCSEEKQTMKLVATNISQWFEKTRPCLKGLRAAVTQQLDEIMQEMTRSLSMLTLHSQQKINKLQAEKLHFSTKCSNLEKELRTLKVEYQMMVVSSQNQAQRIEAATKKYKEEAEDAQDKQLAIQAKYDELKIHFEESSSQKEIISKQFQDLALECRTLKLKLKKAQEDEKENISKFHFIESQLKEKIAASDQVNYELLEENERLKDMLTKLQNQLDRMMLSMNGNKTQFAKFVELKHENVALHQQVITLAKQVDENGGGGGGGSGANKGKNKTRNKSIPGITINSNETDTNKFPIVDPSFTPEPSTLLQQQQQLQQQQPGRRPSGNTSHRNQLRGIDTTASPGTSPRGLKQRYENMMLEGQPAATTTGNTTMANTESRNMMAQEQAISFNSNNPSRITSSSGNRKSNSQREGSLSPRSDFIETERLVGSLHSSSRGGNEYTQQQQNATNLLGVHEIRGAVRNAVMIDTEATAAHDTNSQRNGRRQPIDECSNQNNNVEFEEDGNNNDDNNNNHNNKGSSRFFTVPKVKSRHSARFNLTEVTSPVIASSPFLDLSPNPSKSHSRMSDDYINTFLVPHSDYTTSNNNNNNNNNNPITIGDNQTGEKLHSKDDSRATGGESGTDGSVGDPRTFKPEVPLMGRHTREMLRRARRLEV